VATIPWILHVAVATETLPILAGALKPARLRGARGFVTAWCGVILAHNAAAFILGRQGINTHFLTFIATPIEGALILWGLSLWQVRPIARLTMRIMILPFIVAWGILSLALENVRSFSAVAEPVYCLLALGAALYTVVVRSQDTQEPLTRQDWFWICCALSVLFGMTATLTPLAAAMVRDHPAIVVRAYIVKGYLTVLVFLAITVGMLCPIQREATRA
jgi:hypothetical protein